MSEEPTTPDLVERQRQVVEAGTRVDEAMRFYAPGAVWDGSHTGVGTFEGAAAVRRFFEDWLAAYEEYRHELVECRDLGNGVVFTVLDIVGRLAGSPSRVRETWSWTATWV